MDIKEKIKVLSEIRPEAHTEVEIRYAVEGIWQELRDIKLLLIKQTEKVIANR